MLEQLILYILEKGNKKTFKIKKATSAKRFEKENPLFRDLSDGTKYVLNAPGKDWNLDLSIPKVRICSWKSNQIKSNQTHLT